jgi:hypothetical protein
MKNISELETLIAWGSAIVAISMYSTLSPTVRDPIKGTMLTTYHNLSPRTKRHIEKVAEIIIPRGLRGYENLKMVQEKVSRLFYPSYFISSEGISP